MSCADSRERPIAGRARKNHNLNWRIRWIPITVPIGRGKRGRDTQLPKRKKEKPRRSLR